MSERGDPPKSGGDSLTLTPDERRVVAVLVRALRRIRHGSIQIIVQDSRVVQVDTLEKHRLARDRDSAPPGAGGTR